MVFLVFAVLLVPSLFLLVHFFLLVLGLGFRGGFFLFWGPGRFSWDLGLFLVYSCSFLVSLCPFLLLGGLGGFPGDWVILLVLGGLPVLVYLLVPFLLLDFILFLSCSFLLSSCSFSSCFGEPGCFPGFLGSFCSLLVCSSCSFSSCLGGLGGFPRVWGSSCSCHVSSCSFSFCFGGLGGFPGVWGFFLFLSCFF